MNPCKASSSILKPANHGSESLRNRRHLRGWNLSTITGNLGLDVTATCKRLLLTEHSSVPDKPIEVLEPLWSGNLLLLVKTVWKTMRQSHSRKGKLNLGALLQHGKRLNTITNQKLGDWNLWVGEESFCLPPASGFHLSFLVFQIVG